MFKHVLFPTDESDTSFIAFPAALEMARKFGGRITVLNIHEEFLDSEERLYLRVSPQQYQEMMTEHARKSREKIQAKLDEFKVDVPLDIAIREGNPRRIDELSAELEADIVVMASHGHTSLGALVLGSVAEHVVRHANVPVMVVKPSN